MSLISSGIDAVRALELPGGIWADGGYVETPLAALVKWRSCWSDMLYQVYINGRYAGTTVDGEQRQMIVQIPTSIQSPVRIEVFAVEAAQAHIDFGEQLGSSNARSGRVRIRMLRGQCLPIEAAVDVYFDNGTGQIDYGAPLNDSPIRVWPAWQDKAGFGMSRFGASDFGYDSAAAVGFGKGSFGHSQFGLDADTLQWTSAQMQPGAYRFAVKITDRAGNESDGSETDQIAVTPAARPADQVSVSSFDKQMNQLVLNVS